MTTESNNTYQFENLSNASRVTRVVIAAAFIGSVIMVSGPIGGLAILPLLSVYLVFTATISWDPISALFSYGRNKVSSTNDTVDHHHHPV